MPTAHVRDLAKVGVITDISPYSVPPQAWSMGVNVRFKNQQVERAPVFRRIPLTLSDTNPRFLASSLPAAGFDTLYVGYQTGRVYSIVSTVQTNVSIAGYVDSSSEEIFSFAKLADVVYINRNDRVPWSRKTTDAVFQTLAGGWDSTWRAKVIRACNGSLCAFGVTKSGTYYPTMVKTSNIVSSVNTIPSTWDPADTTANATETILAEMKGPIVDAQNFGSNIVIYGNFESWMMTPDGSSSVFTYRRLFNDAGAINANCVVEWEGSHLVFGQDDIWMHDGNTKKSISEEMVRRFVFDNLNLAEARRCHVELDRKRKEARFNYVSGDTFLSFLGTTGCNRCAVLNLNNMTWTFDDLPSVFHMTTVNTDVTLTYDTVTATYDTIGSTYLDQEDAHKKVLVACGDANATYTLSNSIYAIDEPYQGSIVPYAVDTNATKYPFLQHVGIDLDELAEDYRGYKICSSMFPQATFQPGAQPLEFSFGSADNFNTDVTWTDYQTYDASTYTKCDFNTAGRYLAIRMRHQDTKYFRFTGYDVLFDLYGQE